jgi:hypothetical protein
MAESRQSVRVSALVERWREPAAMALAAVAVLGMLIVGIARMHESHAPSVSPTEFFHSSAATLER